MEDAEGFIKRIAQFKEEERQRLKKEQEEAELQKKRDEARRKVQDLAKNRYVYYIILCKPKALQLEEREKRKQERQEDLRQ